LCTFKAEEDDGKALVEHDQLEAAQTNKKKKKYLGNITYRVRIFTLLLSNYNITQNGCW
jgi:hypothetical protein